MNNSFIHGTNSSSSHTNGTNGTVCLDSVQNELSSGSAAFITIALIFGCMSQLPGSLVTSKCNRFWRILPFMSLTEGFIIFFRIACPLLNSTCTQFRRRLPVNSRWHLESFEQQGRSAARTTAYALLAERSGNKRENDYWLKLQDRMSAPTIAQMLGLLDEVARLEGGVTLRPVLILPMMLQFFKLCIIKGNFFIVKLLPLMYFWSWFWVEVLLLLVHGEKLCDTNMLEADRILHLSIASAQNRFPERWKIREKLASRLSAGDRSSAFEVANAEPTSPAQEQAATAYEPAITELQRQREQAWRQRDVLLTKPIIKEYVPFDCFLSPAIRVKYSTTEPQFSRKRIVQGFYGEEAAVVDFYTSTLVNSLALFNFFDRDSRAVPIFVLAIYIQAFLDFCIGLGLARLVAFIKKKDQDLIPWTRGWLAFRVTIIILFYFTVLYTPEGTSKPDWIDWLG